MNSMTGYWLIKKRSLANCCGVREINHWMWCWSVTVTPFHVKSNHTTFLCWSLSCHSTPLNWVYGVEGEGSRKRVGWAPTNMLFGLGWFYFFIYISCTCKMYIFVRLPTWVWCFIVLWPLNGNVTQTLRNSFLVIKGWKSQFV